MEASIRCPQLRHQNIAFEMPLAEGDRHVRVSAFGWYRRIHLVSRFRRSGSVVPEDYRLMNWRPDWGDEANQDLEQQR